jgi:hypothetical protein
MLTGRGRVIVRVVYMEPTDPVIEQPRQACQLSRWHSQHRFDLVRGQLKAELETGAGRVQKEISPKTGVRQQATERPFDVALAHALSLRQGSHQAYSRLSEDAWCTFARECVNPHANVVVRTSPHRPAAKL